MEEKEIVMYCDLHGHSRKQNMFIYGCENKGNPLKRLRERIFPVMLSKNAPDKVNETTIIFASFLGEMDTVQVWGHQAVCWSRSALKSSPVSWPETRKLTALASSGVFAFSDKRPMFVFSSLTTAASSRSRRAKRERVASSCGTWAFPTATRSR